MAIKGKKNWIAGAVKRKGALTKKAKAAGALTKEGTIKKDWLQQATKKKGRIGRQARTAKTLGELRKKKKGGKK